jgi:RNA polymerase sigma-70 factor (family 1)
MTPYQHELNSKEFDAAFFEQAFREHYSFLCAVAFQVVEDEDVAKDIVQDFFLYCWTKKVSLYNYENFKSYAYRAIRNASLNFRKRSKKISFESQLYLEKAADEEKTDEADKEVLRIGLLWELIGRMPQQRRHIFLLSNRDGLKYTEIAAHLNISVNTVKTHIRLAYEYLRKVGNLMVSILLLIIFSN